MNLEKNKNTLIKFFSGFTKNYDESKKEIVIYNDFLLKAGELPNHNTILLLTAFSVFSFLLSSMALYHLNNYKRDDKDCEIYREKSYQNFILIQIIITVSSFMLLILTFINKPEDKSSNVKKILKMPYLMYSFSFLFSFIATISGGDFIQNKHGYRASKLFLLSNMCISFVCMSNIIHKVINIEINKSLATMFHNIRKYMMTSYNSMSKNALNLQNFRGGSKTNLIFFLIAGIFVISPVIIMIVLFHQGYFATE